MITSILCTPYLYNQHDHRIMGMDWAPKTNRLVTCGAVSLTSSSNGYKTF